MIAAVMPPRTSRRPDAESIRRDGPQAVYHQVAERLAEEIRGVHQPGDRIPPEPELAARYAVNRHTLRHAVDLLESQGLVERRRGLGTYVLDPPLPYPLHSQARFSDNLAAAGRGRESRLLQAACEPVPAEVGAALRLDPGNTAWRLETLRAVEGRPVTLITHWLPLKPFPELAAAYRGGSLHDLLARRYGVATRRRTTAIAAQIADPADARLLRMAPNHPVLRLRTLNVDAATAAPVELALSRIRADRLELVVDHPEEGP